MNIEHTDLNPTSHSQANSARQVENETRAQRREVSRSDLPERDRSDLSDLARIMAKLHPHLEESPEIRTELVEYLRNQINNGTYQVPIEEIVERLVSGKST